MSYNKIPVSTSEVNTALLCETRWMFAHHPAYNLEPRKLSLALRRGLLGHEVLEHHYKRLQEEVDYDTSSQLVLTELMTFSMKAIATGDSELAGIAAELKPRLEEYLSFYKSDVADWKILEVEEVIMADLEHSELAIWAGKIDIVVYVLRGKYKGETQAVDHKFVYNFWPDGALKVNAQLPNYTWALRKKYSEAFIKRGIVNQIRYRANANERFRRDEVVPTRAKLAKLTRNHARIGTKLAYFKQQPVEEVENLVSINASKFNCEYCPFTRLCDARLDDRDVSMMVKGEFRSNSYGYAERNDG
jgi:hypothetical protein